MGEQDEGKTSGMEGKREKKKTRNRCAEFGGVRRSRPDSWPQGMASGLVLRMVQGWQGREEEAAGVFCGFLIAA